MLRIAFCAAALAAATPAAAADFKGPYVGAGLVYDGFKGGPASLPGDDPSGVGVATFAGYNISDGKLFGGLEANLDLTNVSEDDFESTLGGGVGGRFGYLISRSAAVYGRVGYQRNRIDIEADTSTIDGTRFGVGMEAGFTSNARVRFEVNHFNFDRDIKNNQAVVAALYAF